MQTDTPADLELAQMTAEEYEAHDAAVTTAQMEKVIETFILQSPSRQVRRAANRKAHRNIVDGVARGRARRRLRRRIAKASLQRNRRG